MKKNILLSAVVSAYNAEKKLDSCLQSLQFADELIVVNNSSIDKTESIAKKYTPHVFTRINNPMLNVNKNFGFTKATGEWILYLDDDERITPELKTEIEQIIKTGKADGYWIPRKNIIFGKWIQNAIWWPDYQLRLFKNGKGKFPELHVHEAIHIVGETENLKAPMLHESYKTINEYLFKLSTIYTDSEADAILAKGKDLSWQDAIRMPIDDFLKTFFLQKGFRDGLHGLVLSLLQAFYSLVVFAKVWERQGFKEVNSPSFLEDVHKEFNTSHYKLQYWFFTSFMHESKSAMKRNYFRILRKRLQGKTK